VATAPWLAKQRTQLTASNEEHSDFQRVYHTARGRGIAERLTHESGDPPNDEKDDCQSDGVGAGMILLMLAVRAANSAQRKTDGLAFVTAVEVLLHRRWSAPPQAVGCPLCRSTAVYRAVTA
jgi:hypothetical protein